MNAQLKDSYELEGYVNRPMSQTEIIKMLDMHGNGWHIVDGVLYAGDSLTEEDDRIVKTTDWQLFDVLDYLNY